MGGTREDRFHRFRHEILSAGRLAATVRGSFAAAPSVKRGRPLDGVRQLLVRAIVPVCPAVVSVVLGRREEGGGGGGRGEVGGQGRWGG